MPKYEETKLERVLRHSIHLLLADESFNFRNLRRLILDFEYRNDLIKKLKYRLFYLIDSYGIEEIILNINDNHYDTSLITELINEYNMKYNGKLTVK